jgi:hypothetical protein
MFTHPALLLPIEEAALLAACVLLYAHLHFSWLLFGVLLLAPDLFMLGYLINVRIGSAIYNIGHFLLLPLALFAVSILMGRPSLMAIAIIWFSHIVLDRMLGFGLKYPTVFKDTHLQRIG